ncbi:MAG: MarR family transcriptional regulator [Emcibacteraceae bacterium]|nr:MarR family transcriptional regulator [Emcibacteraceae bacterium]
MTTINQGTLSGVRQASRIMVRKFGFLNRTLAGTNYSPSAVHALIDIGTSEDTTAKMLSNNLFLEKSSISRLLQKLIKEGEVEEIRSDVDARTKYLVLTKKGKNTLENINAFGISQVSEALEGLNEKSRNTVYQGLSLYSNALSPEVKQVKNNEIMITAGYGAGLIGKISTLHAKIHGEIAGLGLNFECLVASGMAEFMPLVHREKNNTWYAEQNNEIIGGISIDGEGLGNNIAHLRWFVIDNAAQGAGLGAKLLKKALDFCDHQGFDATHLWTYKGLDAARSLYERQGFKLVEEKLDTQYGKELLEQKYIRIK